MLIINCSTDSSDRKWATIRERVTFQPSHPPTPPLIFGDILGIAFDAGPLLKCQGFDFYVAFVETDAIYF